MTQLYISEFRKIKAMPVEVHNAYSVLRSLIELRSVYHRRGVTGQAYDDLVVAIEEQNDVITAWATAFANQQAHKPE